MNEVDVYRIAHLLLDEYGVHAREEVKTKLAHYMSTEDFGSVKVWFEVEDALKEIQASSKDTGTGFYKQEAAS